MTFEIGKLDSDILAKGTKISPLEMLRQDIEDALKEYSIDDVLVELIQNALDAIDLKRFELFCEKVSVDSSDREIVEKWNRVVDSLIKNDYDQYCKAVKNQASLAIFYRKCSNTLERKEKWLLNLCQEFGCEHLMTSVREIFDAQSEVNIGFDFDDCDGVWIEVEDDGTGIEDVLHAFTHKFSSKRHTYSRVKRLGERGSHGWGLSAVIGLSNQVEVVSCKKGSSKAYLFSQYKSFVSGEVHEPLNFELVPDSPKANKLSQKILDGSKNGTHVRIKLDNFDDSTIFGHLLRKENVGLLANYLQMSTPIGQVNDYVFHPSFHCIRKDGLNVRLSVKKSGAVKDFKDVPFEHFDISSFIGDSYKPFDSFIESAARANCSVHTIHRSKRGVDYYLSAAEIQSAELIKELVEKPLKDKEELPGFIGVKDEFIGNVPRGFQLALSGGMKTQYFAIEPYRNVAAFRGIILSETAKPTLGRKHVMDQRTHIPKASMEHVNTYDSARKDTLPKASPKPTSPKEHKWRREQIERTVDEIRCQPIEYSNINIWAGKESREAKVMLLFGELIGLGVITHMNVLRTHLSDKYDFYYLSKVPKGISPSCAYLSELSSSGFVDGDDPELYVTYGVGEFKYNGTDVIVDFDTKDSRKSPNMIDLLVCWDFDEGNVSDKGWNSAVVTERNRIHPAQTHSWTSTVKSLRERELAVISLKSLMEISREAGILEQRGGAWGDTDLPEVYY